MRRAGELLLSHAASFNLARARATALLDQHRAELVQLTR
jgi:hypothetical protein